MRKIFTAQHPTEAHLITGVLSSEGIEAMIQGESLFGARGEAPVTPDTLPSIWVGDADVERALAVLRTRATGDEIAGLERRWTCARCGESVEPQFAACWNCGAEAPTE